MQKTAVGKRLKDIGWMLLTPWTYHAIYVVFYVLCLIVYSELDDWSEQNYYLFDTMFCVSAMIIYLVWYRKITAADEIHSERIPRKKLGPSSYLKGTVLAFGLSGISQWWLIAVSELLAEGNILGMGESLENFNESWSVHEGEPYLWMFLSVVLLGPIVEELVFRGIQFSLARRVKRGWFPIVFTALSFGLWHGEPVQVVYTAITGIGIGIVAAYTGSLWLPVYMHIVNNFLSTLPPAWETEEVTDVLVLVHWVCILPALFLLIRMVRKMRNRTRTLHEPKREEIEAKTE